MKKSDIELRDWYAGLAMQAWLAHDLREYNVDDDDIAEISAVAFKVANSMMGTRESVISEDAE
jgi:hypothetical protein